MILVILQAEHRRNQQPALLDRHVRGQPGDLVVDRQLRGRERLPLQLLLDGCELVVVDVAVSDRRHQRARLKPGHLAEQVDQGGVARDVERKPGEHVD